MSLQCCSVNLCQVSIVSKTVNPLVFKDASENELDEREEEEEENTDYLTDSNKENETDEENNVRNFFF